MLSPRPDLETPFATRRLFLRGMAGALAAAAVAPGRLLAGPREERLLSFVHTHTHERLTVPYFADGAYLPEGLVTLEARSSGTSGPGTSTRSTRRSTTS